MLRNRNSGESEVEIICSTSVLQQMFLDNL